MIKTLYFMLFVSVCLIAFSACKAKESEGFTNLSTNDFEKQITDEEVQRLDVRTAAEFAEGHIPGSLNINALDEHFASDAEELLDKTRPVAVYCKGGRRSRNAARILVKRGFTVYNLDKGFENWKEHGKEVDR